MENNMPVWAQLITMAFTLVIGFLTKGFWDYLQKKNDNDTSVKINEENKYKKSIEELELVNKTLFDKLTKAEETLEVSNGQLQQSNAQLEKALLAFEMLFLFVEDITKDNPAYKKAFDKALEVFHSKI